MRELNEIIIHCAATRPSMDIGVDEIRAWHVQGNNWRDIGYHFVIRRDGTVEDGRAVQQSGAHTRGRNANSIAICLVGGVSEHDVHVPENNFTEAQWVSLESLVLSLMDKYGISEVHGHNEYANKACPSFDVHIWRMEHAL